MHLIYIYCFIVFDQILKNLYMQKFFFLQYFNNFYVNVYVCVFKYIAANVWDFQFLLMFVHILLYEILFANKEK